MLQLFFYHISQSLDILSMGKKKDELCGTPIESLLEFLLVPLHLNPLNHL